MSKHIVVSILVLAAVLVTGNLAHAADNSNGDLLKSSVILSNPPLKIVVAPYHPPVNKDECKNDKWMRFENPRFENREACNRYVDTPSMAKSRYIFLNNLNK
ncbi:MAG: hypothetical protein JWL80_132 [Parcubacteria group bacterium]|nr:hypothetical protein [Parcubacteria group bacterium]